MTSEMGDDPQDPQDPQDGRLTPAERRELMAVAHDLQIAESLTVLATENDRLRDALREAPDLTCESPEARAWRAKHAAIIRTVTQRAP